MKKNLKINKKIIYIYVLAFLGLCCILYYLWFRFIRERLPREIPFNLSVIGFFILIYICLIYGFFCYRYIKPKKSSENLYKFLSIFFKPFYYFDKLLKKPLFIHHNIFKALYNTLLFFKLYKTNNNKYFFIVFNIIPKTILILIFLLDVFYIQNLSLFYKSIILGILPLLYTYCIYAITKYLEIISNLLDKYYYVKMLSTEEDEEEYKKNNEGSKFFVSLFFVEYIPEQYSAVLYSKYFIDIQSFNLIFDYDIYKYTCIETGEARELYAKANNIKIPPLRVFEADFDEISKELAKEFRELMPQAYYFKAFIHTHNDFTLPELKKFNIYILCGYLLCWVYILIISLHTLNLFDLITFLKTIKDIQDPFSMEVMIKYYPLH